MELTSPLLVVVAVVLAIGLAVLIAVTRSRRPDGWAGHALRLLGILLSQAMAIGAVVLIANNTYDFYNNWDDLLGGGNGSIPSVASGTLVPPDGSQGRVVTLTVRSPGAKGPGGERLPVLIWLPKQYFQPDFKKTRFPVVMVLPGQPSTPQGVFHEMALSQQGAAAIDSGRVQPFVAVFPPLMIDPPRDTECTNVPNGPQAESWLFENVRSQVIRKLRVDRSGQHRSTLGWSTGGFCAAKLLLRHRDLFHAAVSVGGYFTAETDRTTGDLFGGSRQLRNENSPSWLIKQAGAERSDLLVVVSKQDRDSWAGAFYADGARFVAATRGTPGVATLLLNSGGHSFNTYRPTIPESLTWLQQTGSLG